DVGVVKVQAALADEGGAAVADAAQFQTATQTSPEVTVVAGQFAGAGGQIGIDEPGPDIVARLRAERSPAVAINGPAEDFGGYGPLVGRRLAPGQCLVVALCHQRSEHRFLVIDPERAADFRE